jgi:phosphatidylglycerophosphatase A
MKKPVSLKKIHNPILRFFILASCSGLGLGFSPIAPGTAGSLLGIPLGLWLLKYSVIYSVAFLILLSLFFSWVAEKAGDHWGERDSSKIVIDEVIGQAFTLLGAWVLAHPKKIDTGLEFREFNILEIIQLEPQTWAWTILTAFLLFRALDIVKPFPANRLDRHNSGLGVIGDDVVAGLYGAIVLRFLIPIWAY